MTNITPLYWQASGVSLHTLGWSIKTRGGNRYTTASKRGDDIFVPHSMGSQPRKKLRDSRFVDLPMWIQPYNADGSEDVDLGFEQKMFENWEMLLGAMDVGGQFPLVKRLYSPDDGTTVVAATALAELIEAPEPDIVAQDTMDATFTLKLADPWYYDPVGSQSVGALVVAGNAPTNHIIVTLNGGNNPRVTAPDGNWVQYNGNPSGPVVIDMAKASAKIGANHVNGLISRHHGFAEWMSLEPGDSLVLSGGGTATVTYEAAYK